jgi:hypothetical protein
MQGKKIFIKQYYLSRVCRLHQKINSFSAGWFWQSLFYNEVVLQVTELL